MGTTMEPAREIEPTRPNTWSQSSLKAEPWRQQALVASLLLLVALAARAQTFGNPVLGFDEQFYLLVGDRMLDGFVPFVDIFDRKPIGLFLIYAFIRLLGGEGTVQYQVVAGLFAWTTAFFVWRLARRLGSRTGAIAAAIAYLLWLDFLQGEGGQAAVFFNLPMVIAALLTERLVTRRSATAPSAIAPMLLVGVAIQIKYTAIFEGIFFGCALLYSAWQSLGFGWQLAKMAALWTAAALAPTVAAYLWYVAIGHGHEFLFANFFSMWGKLPDPSETSAIGLLAIFGILLPLLMCATFPPPSHPGTQILSRNFVRHWLAAAVAGMVAMRSFSTMQYAMPLLAPTVILAGQRLGRFKPDRRLVWFALLVAFVATQMVLASHRSRKGGAREAALMARAATPRNGCLFVYDGYPALYRLTHSCLLSRFVFPGHLNSANENSVRALGVDPSTEIRIILGKRPDTIVINDPPFDRGNMETYSIVRRELERNYDNVFAMGAKNRKRLVFRRRLTNASSTP